MTISVSTSRAQPLDPDFRLDGPPLALEPERPGHHPDSQRAKRPGDVGDHRRTAGTGAAALTRRDEDHVGALEHLFDLLAVIFRGPGADVRVRPGAEPAGQFPADVELDVGVAHQQGLRVGVNRDELDALQSLFDHAIDGVNAASADSDDLDDRQIVLRCCHEEGTFPLAFPAAPGVIAPRPGSGPDLGKPALVATRPAGRKSAVGEPAEFTASDVGHPPWSNCLSRARWPSGFTFRLRFRVLSSLRLIRTVGWEGTTVN